jgi:hypothetical protein
VRRDPRDQQIREYRAGTFRLKPGKRVSTKEGAIDFVNERGFVYFWPIKDILMPSLWVAVAGDRPVADEHNDPGHVTWGWKDSLLGERRWYYAKVLRKRATIISLEIAPYFYALSENYGSPESDYLTQYEQGRLTRESRLIYEALLEESPLDTVQLRQRTHMTSRESDYPFNRSLIELQSDFKILPVGVTDSGGWRYAFAYDLVPRYLPEIPERARFIQEDEARKKLTELYFLSVGAAQANDLVKVFGWRPAEVKKAVEALVEDGVLRRGLALDGATVQLPAKQQLEWIALAELG